MAEQPLTDAELQELIRLDDARTPGEYGYAAADREGGEAPILCVVRNGHAIGPYIATIGEAAALGLEWDAPVYHNANWVAGCTRVVRRMAEELLRRRQAEARMWADVERIHGGPGEDFAPDDPTVYRENDPTTYHAGDAPEEPPCPICGGRGRCRFTRGRLAEVRELTVDDWREVHEFTMRVFMPFVHGVIAKAKARAEGV